MVDAAGTPVAGTSTVLRVTHTVTYGTAHDSQRIVKWIMEYDPNRLTAAQDIASAVNSARHATATAKFYASDIQAGYDLLSESTRSDSSTPQEVLTGFDALQSAASAETDESGRLTANEFITWHEKIYARPPTSTALANLFPEGVEKIVRQNRPLH
eukprot:SAG31_NODE_692_length_12772_cov_15.543044_11_plen_156_part_00